MLVVIGLFETQPQAEAALIRLRDAGFRNEQMALIANEPPAATEDLAAPVEARRTATETDRVIDDTALGTAVGVILGGALLGPGGLLLGSVAGGGIAAALAARGVPDHEAQAYEAQVSAGRYLVAVEVESEEHGPAEVRALLEQVGAEEVVIEA